MSELTDLKLPNPDFEAEVYYLTEYEGGRKTPVENGYRGQFYYDTKNWDAPQQFLDKNSCTPGDTVKVLMQTASPSNHAEKLFVGKLFEIREGTTIVGIGKITKIINSSFIKSKLYNYEVQIEKIILANKEFKITEVHNLQSIRSTIFNFDEYKSIKPLLEQNKWYQIKERNKENAAFYEYLYIVSFQDENGKNYIASIYDNDELWQDPQLIDIFST